MGMVSVDALLPSTIEGKVLAHLENHFSVAADLEAGTCVENVTALTRGQSVEEVAETMTLLRSPRNHRKLAGSMKSSPSNEQTRC